MNTQLKQQTNKNRGRVSYPKCLALKDLLAPLLVCKCHVFWPPKDWHIAQQLKQDTAHAEDISCRGDRVLFRLPKVVQTLRACIGRCDADASAICKSVKQILTTIAHDGQLIA